MNFKKISNTLKNINKLIFLDLSVEKLESILSEDSNNHIIIKFGANWCLPCKKIESTLNDCFLEMPNNVYCFDLDIDDNMELFGKLKAKKMIKTIPAILYYNCKNDRDDKWYISDMSLFSSDKKEVLNFFAEIYKNL